MEKLQFYKKVIQDYNNFNQNNMVLHDAILITSEDKKLEFKRLKEEALKLIGQLTAARTLLVDDSTKKNKYSEKIEILEDYKSKLDQIIDDINAALYKKLEAI